MVSGDLGTPLISSVPADAGSRQNRRQKAKRFALPEKPAKISRCASLGDALIPKRPRGPGKENIAPGTTSDAASVFRVHPTYPRSVTAPLLNEPVNIAARPSFSRPALARAHTLDPALLALADRMPDSSSSPIKFADHPYIRRSPSFTLDWAATQQSLRPISVEANVVDEGNSAALTTARAKKASTLTQLSIPSGPSPFLPTGKPQSISLSPASISGLDELLQAARQAQEPEEDESLTDEEVTVAAKKMGGHGDESFSSIGSDEASDDEEARLAASVLLGLVGGW